MLNVCLYAARYFHYCCFACLLLPLAGQAQRTSGGEPATGSTVDTVAGVADSKGYADGPGSAARFGRPMGLAVDKEGTVYVADAVSMTIRKITADNVVTTLAGTANTTGNRDGVAVIAQFLNPTGVAVDQLGCVYVADAGNHTIRKITPAGVVTTVAGLAGSKGSLDGSGVAARFNFPQGLAIDTSGTLYVADTENHIIRKITSDGVVTTLAGVSGRKGSNDGAGATAHFYHPFGMAVDSQGAVYVTDNGNSTIRKITATGEVSTLAGSAGHEGNLDGLASAARFFFPTGVALGADGTLYVAEAGTSVVRKITATGEVTTLAGTAFKPGHIDGMGAVARFKSPSGIAVDARGTVYVSDSKSSTIRMIK